MKYFLLIVIAACSVGCSREVASSTPIEISMAVETDAGEAQFSFAKPEGFKWYQEQGAWYNKDLRASILLAHESGVTFQSVVDDLVAENMLRAGMEMLRKDILDEHGRQTLVVQGNRLNGKYPQQFCTVAYATVSGCVQVTATYPTAMKESMKSRIETALVSSHFVMLE